MKYSPRELLHLALNQEGLMFVTAGNVSSVLLSTIIWFILARLVTVPEYGRLNYFLSIGALLSSFTALGLPLTLQTYLPKGVNEITAGSIILVLMTSLAAGTPFALLHPSIPLIAISYSLFNLAAKERLGRRKYGSYALMQSMSRLILLLWVLLLVPELGTDIALYGFGIVYLIFSVWIFKELRNPLASIREVRKYIGFSLAALATGLTTAIGLRVDKVFIGYLYGNEMLGYYQLAYQFYAALTVLPGSLASYVLPEKSSGRKTRAEEIVGIGLSILSAIAGVIVAPLLIKELFPKFYPESSVASQIVSLAIIFDSLFGIWFASKYSQERPLPVLAVNLASIGILLSSIYLLGSTMGVVGLALSLLIYRAAASALGFIENRVNLSS